MPPRTKRKAESDLVPEPPASTRRKTTASNDFVTTSKAENEWKMYHSVLYFRNPKHVGIASKENPVKIAAFDMDSTLVYPKSGAKFAKDRNDWEWQYSCVPEKLKEYHNKGFQIVIITNQKGAKTAAEQKELTAKIDTLEQICGIPFSSFICLKGDLFRKPSVCIWDFAVDTFLPETDVEDAKLYLDPASFYCGDAAGRFVAPPKAQGWKKDHSDVDRALAYNAGVNFYTPEVFFLDAPEPGANTWKWGCLPLVDEKTLEQHIASSETIGKSHMEQFGIKPSDTTELLLFCGPPGSGKTSIAREFEAHHNYARSNRDDLKTTSKLEQVLHNAFKQGKSVVMDNTNPTPDKRKPWIDIAKKYNVKVRCITITIPKTTTMALTTLRNSLTRGQVDTIPDVVIHTFYKNYAEPTTKEGIDEIIPIEWSLQYHTIAHLYKAEWENIQSSIKELGHFSKARSFKDFIKQRFE